MRQRTDTTAHVAILTEVALGDRVTLKHLARITHRHVNRAASSAAVNIHVRDLAQLLNSLDPSPFWDRDLDPIAAEFIEEEFSEKLADDTWNLHVHVHEGGTSPTDLQAALENYYGRMASSARRALREHLWSSHRMLIGGVVVFLLSMGLRSALARIFGTLPQILDEGLIILAWLALWRPAEMLLYGWIPLRRKRRLYERFAGIRVFVRPDTLAPAGTSGAPITAGPQSALPASSLHERAIPEAVSVSRCTQPRFP